MTHTGHLIEIDGLHWEACHGCDVLAVDVCDWIKQHRKETA